MHNSCGEIFNGFCRNPVQISESVWTTCCEINENKWFRTTFFSNFLIFSSQAYNHNGHEGGGVAEDAGGKVGEGVGHISVKIKLTAFYMHLTLSNQLQVDVHVEFCYLSVNGTDLSECTYFIF